MYALFGLFSMQSMSVNWSQCMYVLFWTFSCCTHCEFQAWGNSHNPAWLETFWHQEKTLAAWNLGLYYVTTQLAEHGIFRSLDHVAWVNKIGCWVIASSPGDAKFFFSWVPRKGTPAHAGYPIWYMWYRPGSEINWRSDVRFGWQRAAGPNMKNKHQILNLQ